MTTPGKHETVLKQAAVDALNLSPESIVVDGTFGRGGHSREILRQIPKGRLIAFDKDPEAIEYAQQHFEPFDNFAIRQQSFAEIESTISSLGLEQQVDSILLDLGVSSPQLDQAERGFSFSKDGPLDMRMDPETGMSARDWLFYAEERDIRFVLKAFGEEKYAGRIAKAIVEARHEQPLETTLQLANLIKDVLPKKDIGKHPATRSFQGIRIYINNELDELEKGLQGAFEILKHGGRLVVISFHSLEDRIVKRFFKKLSKGDDFPRDLPVMENQIKPKLKLLSRAIKAEADEVESNIRSRSAIMRVAEKL